MRLFEIISDCIFEMAFKRSEVESKTTDISYQVIEHLIKTLTWEDDLNYQKHLSDINSWIYRIQSLRLKGNKKPSNYDYYQWMFTDVLHDEETTRRWIKGLHDYHKLKQLRDYDEVFNIIKAIIYKVSFDLPLNKFEDIRHYI
jgi:hypothetical protein